MDITDWLNEHGIRINDKDLIHQAFIHSSYANEHRNKHDNERLEFMGDAVLQLWSSTQIYPLDPPLTEGEMTRLRSRLVCEKALAEYGRKLGLNRFLKLGTGEEKTGGRNKDAIIADMFEAIGDSEAIISAEQFKGLAEQARQKRIYTEINPYVNYNFK